MKTKKISLILVILLMVGFTTGLFANPIGIELDWNAPEESSALQMGSTPDTDDNDPAWITTEWPYAHFDGITIYDIQYTTDPSGDSPYNGQIVTTTGIVTAVESNGYFIQDGAGEWNGIYVYDSNTPAMGDEVLLTAEVYEYYDMTELKNLTTFSIVSSSNPLPTPTIITTGSLDSVEANEGVLIQVINAICTDTLFQYGQWFIDDETGWAIVDDAIFLYIPTIGNNYDVTGVVFYTWGAYRLLPRDIDDIIDNSAQTTVTFNVNMNYQITLGNFNPETEFVDLAGDFNNWGNPGDVLSDANSDGIYTVVLTNLNVGDYIEFKFRINGDWNNAEFPDGPNRIYTVVSTNDVLDFWYNDEYPPADFGPPTDFVVSENGYATWDVPSGGGTGEWLFYDEGVNTSGIGSAESFSWAIKFDPDQLTAYDGNSVSKIRVFCLSEEVNTLQIFEGTDASTLLFEQDLVELNIEAWNEVELTSPVTIDASQELWITIYTEEDEALAGCGDYMGEPNGDLISFDGDSWNRLTDYGYYITWNLGCYVTDEMGKTVSLGEIPNDKVYNNQSTDLTFVNSGEINNSPNAIRSKDLIGYNLYLDGASRGTTTDLFWQYADLTPGQTYMGGVSAVYNDGESEVVEHEFTVPGGGADCEDFDDLTVGGYVAEQLGGMWTTWSGAPGTSEDAIVSDLYSVSPFNSILVEGTTDLVRVFSDATLTSGSYTFTNDIYIPTGTTGYWNLQKDHNIGIEWGFQIMYDYEMNMIIDAGGAAAAVIPYTYDTWYHNEIVVDLDNDWCEFFVDGELIIGYQWTLGPFGNQGANTLGSANLYANPGAGEIPPGAHFDDVCFSGGGSGTLDPPTDFMVTDEGHGTWTAPSTLMVENFEGEVPVFTVFGYIVDIAVVPNPDQSGANTTANTAMLTKSAGAETWAGCFFESALLDFDSYCSVKVLTWSPKIGIVVKVKIENEDASITHEVDVTNTAANTWEELIYDFSGAPEADYVKIVIFFDFGNPGDDSIYYFDEIQLLENSNALLGYNLYLDYEMVGTTADLFWQYADLTAGQTYMGGVSVVYDEGESIIVDYEFTVPGGTLDLPTDFFITDAGYGTWTAPGSGTSGWLFYHDGSFESATCSEGGAGLAQLFTPAEYPVTITEIKYWHSSAGNPEQEENVYLLSGDGSTVLDGPYSVTGETGDAFITIDINDLTMLEGTFMVYTQNVLENGPYVGVDEDNYDGSLFFGDVGNFVEMGEFEIYAVGSHEAYVTYGVSKDGITPNTSVLRPAKGNSNLSPLDVINQRFDTGVGSVKQKDNTKSRDLLGYNLYLDGTSVGNTPDLFWQYADLTAGQTYMGGVSAVYDDGESEIVEYEFTVTGGCNPPDDWTVNPANFAYNGEVTAQVFVDDIAVENGTLAAFVGNECRGIVDATYFEPSGNYIFTVMCYSNLASGETLSFKYFDPVTCDVCDLSETVDFVADMIIGAPDNPIMLNCGCPLPAGWFVNPPDYAYNGEVTAQVFVDDIAVESGTLAAFVDDECRGVVNATYFPPGGYYTFTVMCYSNLASGETLSFKYFDRVTCEICELDASVDFVADMIEGTSGNPLLFICGGPVTATIDLFQGWTWFSLNIDDDDMSLDNVLTSLTLSENDYIKNQTSSATYYAGYGWYGALTEIDPVLMYQISLANSDVLEFTGMAVDPTMPINLNSGWTWIGYLPQVDLDINVALESLSLEENDYIKNQTGSATYYAGYGWYGALETLSPYDGYKISLQNADVLTYPAETMKSGLHTELPIFSNNIGITVNPYKYEFNGTVTARVFNANVLSSSEDDLLLAYVGNECRGISKAMYFEPTDEFAYQLMIYSNIVEGETITFKYFDSQSNELYECIETIQFTNDMIMADAFNALDLNTKSTLGINNTLDYAAFNVYPNPSSGITTIDYTLKTTSEVHIVVSDIYGKQIKEIENKIKDAGSYSTQWNAEINESGTYFIKIVSNNSIQIRKVVLMK